MFSSPHFPSSLLGKNRLQVAVLREDGFKWLAAANMSKGLQEADHVPFERIIELLEVPLVSWKDCDTTEMFSALF
jgi:hypothetical protein